MKHRQPKPEDSEENRKDNPVGSSLPLTGDPSLDRALWVLSLLLREIAEGKQNEENKPPPPTPPSDED